MKYEEVARDFMLLAICEFGQTTEQRIEAVQGVIDALGLKAKAQGFPVFGGIWNKPCVGPDAKEADELLKSLTDNLKRGKIEREIEQVAAFIDKHKK